MFDRATLEVMHGYVATFASASVKTQDDKDGKAGKAGDDDDECRCQMYISPMSFRVQRENVAGRADRIHQYDGDGLLLASFPSKDLESISLTSFFIRDHSRSRDTATLLDNLFEGEGQGQALVDTLLPLVRMLPNGGLAASAVIGLLPDVARLIARVLKNRRDAVKIYADGSLNFATPPGRSTAPRSGARAGATRATSTPRGTSAPRATRTRRCTASPSRSRSRSGSGSPDHQGPGTP
ncbi:hypothetical protein OV079_29100 [Nannocystis pusilla]|uniref:Uncharacterized protein n=1 Tax=Nannocystis pusilla TaxID=889268 RepID=A0A9X3IZI1_9BACT|nr:hypothetical protein [Nannocystis pusilla]MCY1009551.1 hypothetical protein [Nannocystis pusilla]